LKTVGKGVMCVGAIGIGRRRTCWVCEARYREISARLSVSEGKADFENGRTIYAWVHGNRIS
jgi:hypothetical protein